LYGEIASMEQFHCSYLVAWAAARVEG